MLLGREGMDVSNKGIGYNCRMSNILAGIESRPLWKPMHMQPVFNDCKNRLNGVLEKLFKQGLCLPSGSNLKEEELEEIVEIIRGIGE